MNHRYISEDTMQFQTNDIKFVNSFYDVIKTMLFVFVLFTFAFSFIVKDANIIGPSMENTLFNGDKVILSSLYTDTKSGDIVAIDAEDTLGKSIIKRVVATEGQTLSIDYTTGKVYVDGIVIDEKYTSTFTRMPTNPWQIPFVIPEGYVFVMGDNRMVSLDSRDSSVGLIKEQDIIGKAQFIIYPFNRISYLY